MLKALANELRNLADTTGDQFEEAIKKRLDGKTTEEQVGKLKEFIFLLPPVLKQLSGYWNEKSTPTKAKEMSGLIITYILQPDDFLPERNRGLFGYLDDAYVVVSAFLRIQDLYLRDWQDKTDEERDLTRRSRDLIVAPRIVIPDEAARIDKMIDSFMSGETGGFQEFLQASG
jgi:uncharacterized membrane protein YkvA (DUF1232 family)